MQMCDKKVLKIDKAIFRIDNNYINPVSFVNS